MDSSDKAKEAYHTLYGKEFDDPGPTVVQGMCIGFVIAFTIVGSILIGCEHPFGGYGLLLFAVLFAFMGVMGIHDTERNK
jgi:hypothetical protein